MKFNIDGVDYNVLVTDIKRNGKIKASKLSGEVKSGEMFRDIVGTYYGYTFDVATDRLSPTDYDALYEVLTAPVASHTVIMPYGRSTIKLKVYVDSVSDTLVRDADERLWSGLKVNLIAKKPSRRP